MKPDGGSGCWKDPRVSGARSWRRLRVIPVGRLLGPIVAGNGVKLVRVHCFGAEYRSFPAADVRERLGLGWHVRGRGSLGWSALP